MNETQAIRTLLDAVQQGQISVDDALNHMKRLATEDLGFAQLDHHRGLRQGLAEVIYGEGKLPEETTTIFERLWLRETPAVIATRIDSATAAMVQERVPSAVYHARPRLLIAERAPDPGAVGHIAIVAAGTSDLAVAEEALYVARALGNHTEMIVDVGVAGIHRLFAAWPKIASARVIIAVAGMEGALASVVGGLAECPVLAVPSAVGYGAGQGGQTALMAMLSSCALGVGVFNIGNGIGAAVLASKINHLAEPR